MLATIPSATLLGVDRHARPRRGPRVGTACPASRVVGLPDAACREARDRVRAALLSSGAQLAAAAGSRSTWRPAACARSAPGSTWPSPSACSWPTSRCRPTVVAEHSASSASSASTARSARSRARCRSSTRSTSSRSWWRPASRGRGRSSSGRHVDPRRCAACAELLGRLARRRAVAAAAVARRPAALARAGPTWPTCAASRSPRFALEVAAAGGHHLLMIGPPGVGQDDAGPAAARPAARRSTTTTPSRPPGSTRPPASPLPPGGLVRRPPFRAPHHGASSVALVGGGGALRCGPARSPSPPTACCSSTSWPSSTSTCSTRCASRSRRASCGWPGPATAPRSRPGSCSSRP